MWSYVYATHSHALAHCHAGNGCHISTLCKVAEPQHHFDKIMFAYILACLAVAASLLFRQPPQHLKQSCSLIPFSKAILLLSVCWQMHPTLYFLCLEKIQKMPSLYASAQPTPSTKAILLIPFSHTLAPYCFYH